MHPYISSSEYRDGCVKCSDVVECALLVCVLCQPVPPPSHPYIWSRFFLEIIYNSLHSKKKLKFQEM